MILGTQWYILFNVIGGTTALPAELQLRGAAISACGGCYGGGG